MAAILVRALSAVNSGKVGAAAITSGSGDLFVRVLADPVIKYHRTRTPGAAPSMPRHGIEGLQFRVKEVFVYLLRSVLLTVWSVRVIVIQQGRQIQIAGPARYLSRHGARHERRRQALGSYPSPVSVSTGGALSRFAG